MKRVLFTPLDWGVGHAARCVPLIREFLSEGAEVMIAASGRGELLLREEFPQLLFLPVPRCRIRYAKRVKMHWMMLIQLPRMLIGLVREFLWIRKIVGKYDIDIIVSDNRYGMYCRSAYSIFITHQLQIKAPFRSLERLLSKVVRSLVQQYDECWIPDNLHLPFLAGELSHPKQFPDTKCLYVGSLSRFNRRTRNQLQENQSPELIVILSGQEPQRTVLEELLLEKLRATSMKTLFIRGVLEKKEGLKPTENIVFCNHLDTNSMTEALCEARYVICRSGYSTLMDLAAVDGDFSILLVPTPGQTEQEYLASYYVDNHMAYAVNQERMNDLAFFFDGSKAKIPNSFCSEEVYKKEIKRVLGEE